VASRPRSLSRLATPPSIVLPGTSTLHSSLPRSDTDTLSSLSSLNSLPHCPHRPTSYIPQHITQLVPIVLRPSEPFHSESESLSIECPECHARLHRDPQSLIHHKSLCTAANRILHCRDCWALFTDRKRLVQHKKHCAHSTEAREKRRIDQTTAMTPSPPRPSQPSVTEFVCGTDGCGKTFSSRKTLKQHLKRHTKPYRCTFEGCGKAFGSSWDRKIHERIHSDARPEKCSFCLVTFTDPSARKRHIRRFHGDAVCNPFTCRVCRKQFRVRDDLKRHLTVHHGQGQRTCP